MDKVYMVLSPRSENLVDGILGIFDEQSLAEIHVALSAPDYPENEPPFIYVFNVNNRQRVLDLLMV